MATASTGTDINAQLRPGIYRIYVANVNSDDLGSEGVAVAPAGASVELDSADVDPESLPPGQYLTDEGDHRVTILPPSKPLLPKQLWTVIPGEKGNTIIGRPTNKWPSPFLTYEGAPKPKSGDKIIVRVSDFPPNEWYLEPVPKGHYYLIRVAESKLAIGLSPLTIFPPILHLTEKENEELIWVFQYVHPIVK